MRFTYPSVSLVMMQGTPSATRPDRIADSGAEGKRVRRLKFSRIGTIIPMEATCRLGLG